MCEILLARIKATSEPADTRYGQRLWEIQNVQSSSTKKWFAVFILHFSLHRKQEKYSVFHWTIQRNRIPEYPMHLLAPFWVLINFGRYKIISFNNIKYKKELLKSTCQIALIRFGIQPCYSINSLYCKCICSTLKVLLLILTEDDIIQVGHGKVTATL